MAATLDSAVEAPAPQRRSWFSRLSGSHLLIALAAVVAVVANYAVLRAHDASVRVAVVADALAPGEVVDIGALAFADVRADGAVLATLVPAEDLARFEGHVATARLRPGDPLRRSDLQRPAAAGARRAMSLALAPEHAVAGQLATGDRVDVIEVRDGRAAYLVADAEVLHVPDGELRAGLAAMQPFSVTLAVDDETALRLALAQRHSELHVVRATGASTVAVDRVEADEAGADGTAGGAAPDGPAGGAAGETTEAQP